MPGVSWPPVIPGADLELTLPAPPLNTHGYRYSGRPYLRSSTKTYYDVIRREVLAKRCDVLPFIYKVGVSMICRWGDRRRRDLDNIPKHILDGLTKAGVWHDDQQVDQLHLSRSPIIAKPSMVHVAIWRL